MALNPLLIGVRIAKVRETIGESGKVFAKRCDVDERYIGQLERGEFTPSIQRLDTILSVTGASADYILYGKGEKNNYQAKDALINLINNADKDEIEMYYKRLTSIKAFMNKK